jgi:hypothetical protein
MGTKEILGKTTNRGEFNRIYKRYLEHVGKIRCSRCGYHRGENCTWDCFGTYDSIENLKHPNWKLVSKNRKQWMKKTVKIVKTFSNVLQRDYVEIMF